MEIEFDPAAVLTPFPIDVDVGRHTVTIPALPASAWLAALIRGNDHDIVPGLIEGDDLDDEIAEGIIDGDELGAAARAALAVAAGTTWWAATRLASAATSSTIHAEVLLAGLNPAAVSLGAYLAAALQVATRYAPPDKRAEIHFSLGKPPVGVDPAQWFDEAAAAEGFMAALGATPSYEEAG